MYECLCVSLKERFPREKTEQMRPTGATITAAKKIGKKAKRNDSVLNIHPVDRGKGWVKIQIRGCMMKSLRIVAAIAVLLFSANGVRAEKLLTIVHTNDLHSHFQGFSPEGDYRPFEINADDTLGGWSRVATVIQKTRKEKTNPVLVLDGGDYTMGSLFHMLAREESFELRLLKAMGYDAITLGNHEFDLKPLGLAAILRSAKAHGGPPQIVFAGQVFNRTEPALASLEDAFAEVGVKPYSVLERNGLKIGIFGMMGKDAIEVSPFAKPLTFRDPIEVAKEMVETLRNNEKVDIVICLSHGGLRDNPKKSEDEILAAKVNGIDVIISAHTHTKLDQPLVVNNTIIVQAWCYGRQAGILDLAYDEGKTTVKQYTPVVINSAIPGDETIQGMIDAFKKQIDARLLAGMNLSYDRVIAETKWDLEKKAEESPLGNLLADAIRWSVNAVDSDKNDPASKVVVAVESNGVIRDDLIAGKTGKIIVGDFFRTIPLGIGVDNTMGYPLISFYLYGYEIKRALEILTSVRPLKNDDYFLQLSGIRFTYNPYRMIFDRVSSIEIGSDEEGYLPLNCDKSNKKLYRAAANIYNATFLKVVGSFTYAILDIAPKDKNGTPLDKLSSALVDADPALPGIQELKQWQGAIRYVQSFKDTNGNGIPDIPEKYRGKLGRIVEKPSWNPIHLVSHPTMPTFVALAVIGFILSFILAAILVIAARKRARKG
jgi:5'-nucleotidase / UDP-sugar diphosphatase